MWVLGGEEPSAGGLVGVTPRGGHGRADGRDVSVSSPPSVPSYNDGLEAEALNDGAGVGGPPVAPVAPGRGASASSPRLPSSLSEVRQTAPAAVENSLSRRRGVHTHDMAEITWYRGYRVVVTYKEFRVRAPNGDRAVFPAMSSVRAWVRRHGRG